MAAEPVPSGVRCPSVAATWTWVAKDAPCPSVMAALWAQVAPAYPWLVAAVVAALTSPSAVAVAMLTSLSVVRAASPSARPVALPSGVAQLSACRKSLLQSTRRWVSVAAR
jgi:hypothetical protein